MAVKVLETEATFTDRASAGLEGLSAKIDAAAARAQQARGQYDALSQAIGGLHVQTVAATSASAGLATGLAPAGRALGTLGEQVGGATGAVAGLAGTLGTVFAVGGPIAVGIATTIGLVQKMIDTAGRSDKILEGIARVNIGLEQQRAAAVARDQDLSRSGQEAAAARERAEATASGNVLAVIETERRQRVAAIEAQAAGWIAAGANRVKVEQATSDAIAAVEIETATKRTKAQADLATTLAKARAEEQAAIAGFTATALSAVAQLGPAYADLAKKLNLEQALTATGNALEAVSGLLGASQLTAREAADAVRGLTDKLRDMGATAAQAVAIVPRGLQEAVVSARALETSTYRVGNAFFQTKAQAEDYERSLKKVAVAAKGVETVQTTHSLLDSILAVEVGIQRGTTAVESYGKALTEAADRAKVLDEQLGITAKGGMGALERSLAEQTDRLAALREQLGLPTGATGGGGGGGDGGPSPFRDEGFLPGSLLRQPLGPFGIRQPGLAEVLEALQTGGVEPSQFFGQTGEGAFFPRRPHIVVGQTPFGPILKDAFVALDELTRQIIGQAEAQRRVAEFTENLLSVSTGGGGRFDGGRTPTPRGGVVNVNIEMSGTNIIENERRLYELASQIGANVADRARRGI